MDKIQRERLSMMLKNVVSLPGQDKRRLYGNSYRIEPVKKFTSLPVEKIIKRVMKAALKNETYNELKCIKLCHSISAEIRNRVKQFNFSRYKYICIVTISEKRFSEVQFSSRCLWDPKVDNYAYYRFENKDLVAFGVVYACYYE